MLDGMLVRKVRRRFSWVLQARQKVGTPRRPGSCDSPQQKAAGILCGRQRLYLKVDKSGAKRWVQRIVIGGKRRDIGLGSTTLVTLSGAREKALENRRTARAGGDPLADRDRASHVLTFKQTAEKVHALHLPTWSNAKQGQQWINTLTTYAFPFIGEKKIDTLSTADVLAVLSPIWTAKPETANRVRQRFSTVLKWSIAQSWRETNPAADIAGALPKRSKPVKHHRSLPFDQVAAAIDTVWRSGASMASKLALEFLILTATRSGEVRGTHWDEIDGDTWTVPGKRMKTRKEHRVPLSPRCLEILEAAKALGGGEGFIFPRSRGNTLSDSSLSKLLRELGVDCVPHGFRSSFRMWASEKTDFPREVCGFALESHRLPHTPVATPAFRQLPRHRLKHVRRENGEDSDTIADDKTVRGSFWAPNCAGIAASEFGYFLRFLLNRIKQITGPADLYQNMRWFCVLGDDPPGPGIGGPGGGTVTTPGCLKILRSVMSCITLRQ